MKKIGVILNPNAKKFRTGGVLLSSYYKYISDNVFVSAPQNVKELNSIVEQYKSEKIDYICIGGGDGTIHLVLSELIKVYIPEQTPPVLILKGGTMNNIARSVINRGDGIDILKRLIRRIEKNEIIGTEERLTINVNNKFCFLFGTGFITNFLEKVYSGNEKGAFRNLQVGLMAIKEVFMNVKKCEIVKLTEQAVFIDGKKVLINPVSGILAGTVEHVGMGFSPLKDAVRNDGSFQIITVGLTAAKIMMNLNKLRTGAKIKSPKYSNVSGKSITIKQKGIFTYTMDGEIYTAENELKISSGPMVKLVKM
jgi:diacylglycerol kinase family enzyme